MIFRTSKFRNMDVGEITSTVPATPGYYGLFFPALTFGPDAKLQDIHYLLPVVAWSVMSDGEVWPVLLGEGLVIDCAILMPNGHVYGVGEDPMTHKEWEEYIEDCMLRWHWNGEPR